MYAEEKRNSIIILTLILCAILSYYIFDRTVYHFFSSHPNLSNFSFWEKITIAGDTQFGYVALLFSGTIFFIVRYIFRLEIKPGQLLLLLYNFFTVTFLSQVMKVHFPRYRPVYLKSGLYGFSDKIVENSDSFPSLHTATISAILFPIAFLYPRLKPLCFSIIAIVGLSRIILQLHYLSDVLGGFTLSFLSCTVLDKLMKRDLI
ncbi:MAG: phosphatase PAP2 family protein [Chitinophagaceae bacterium]|nr:phosphatase PAP2 family protein [Chitinophagaceae bacterium]